MYEFCFEFLRMFVCLSFYYYSNFILLLLITVLVSLLDGLFDYLALVGDPTVGTIEVLEHDVVLVPDVAELVRHVSLEDVPHDPVLQEPPRKLLEHRLVPHEGLVVLLVRHQVLLQHPEPADLLDVPRVVLRHVLVQLLVLPTELHHLALVFLVGELPHRTPGQVPTDVLIVVLGQLLLLGTALSHNKHVVIHILVQDHVGVHHHLIIASLNVIVVVHQAHPVAALVALDEVEEVIGIHYLVGIIFLVVTSAATLGAGRDRPVPVHELLQLELRQSSHNSLTRPGGEIEVAILVVEVVTVVVHLHRGDDGTGQHLPLLEDAAPTEEVGRVLIVFAHPLVLEVVVEVRMGVPAGEESHDRTHRHRRVSVRVVVVESHLCFCGIR